MSEIIPVLIKILEEYGYAIIFLGTVLGGELIVLAAVFLALLGFFNIYLVALIGLSGIIISDNFWYFIGGRLRGKLDGLSRRLLSRRFRLKIERFKHRFDRHYAKALVMSKFVYGTRILTLLTAGYQRTPYRRFFIFNLLGSGLWMLLIVLLGYVIGLSWNYLAQYNETAKYYVLFGLLALFVLRYAFRRIINLDLYGQRSGRNQG